MSAEFQKLRQVAMIQGGLNWLSSMVVLCPMVWRRLWLMIRAWFKSRKQNEFDWRKLQKRNT